MALSPELELICRAARLPQQPEDAEALRRAAASGLDWAEVVQSSQENRVTASVLAALDSCHSPDVPAEVIAELRRQNFLEAQQTLRQMAELIRLGRKFATAGIPLLVLKGVVLGIQLFGNPALRWARDIDLYVSPGDVGRADLLLRDAGYTSTRDTLSAVDQAVCWRWGKENEYVHAATGGVVELHNRLTDNPDLLPWDFDTLWNEREELRVGEVLVATLSPRRLPLYLCLHGALHGWQRLRWLLDFATLLRREPDTLSAAMLAAEDAGLGPVMLQAVALAHHWLGAPVADRYLRQASSSKAVRRLDFVLRRFAGNAPFGSPELGWWIHHQKFSIWLRVYHMLMKPGGRYWAREIARAWISTADRTMLRLPPMLSWLYPVIRPFGWLLRR